MIKVERRPLSEREIEGLREAANPTPIAGNSSQMGVAIGIAVFAFSLLSGIPWFICAALGAFAWRMAVVAVRRRREVAQMFVQASAGVYQRDLETGEAEVISVEASEMVSRPPRVDGPPAFVFDVGGGELFAVMDVCLSAAVEAEKFPCSRFELVVGPESGIVMSVDCQGEPLTPEEVIDFELLESPQLFEGKLSELGMDD